MTAPLTLPRFRKFKGNVRLPGSKSIANRVLLLAALSRGRTQIHGLPPADDIDALLTALPKLGVTLNLEQEQEQTNAANASRRCEIISQGAPFATPQATLDLANAGTALRPLTALLCAGHGNFTVTGNEQMRRRPIADLCLALQRHGRRY